MPALGFVALVCAVLSPWVAWAKPQTVVRVTAGEHPYFGRVVLNAPGLAYTVNRDGGHVVIQFSEQPILGELPPTPRNVLAIRAVTGGVELTVPPGASVHTSRIGDKVVVDVDDTVPGRPAPAPPTDVHDPPKREYREPKSNVATSAPGATLAGAATPSPRNPGPVNAPGATPPAARSAAPERASGAGEPGNGGAAAEIPAKQPVVSAPKHDAVRPDITTPVAPVTTSSTPATANAPTAAAEPRAADPTSRAMAAASLETLPGNAALTAATEPPAVRQEGRRDGQPERQSDARADALPDAGPEARHAGQPDGTVPTQPASIQVWPVTRDAVRPGPVALLAIKARPPGGLAGVAVRIPFTGAVGAALFSRGSDTVVVFDERRPIDLSAVRDDPMFASAVVTLYAAATVIHLTTPPGQSAMLFPAQMGWRLSIVTASPKPTALPLVTADGVMTFAADAPGQVVGIADPGTGGTLLVGTQRVSGQAVPIERRTPEFILPVTGQGIVVEPLSDAISLRITQTGFVLSGARAGLALSPPQAAPEATMAAARLTRLFEFPRQTTTDLAWRARLQTFAAATSPLLTRGPKRHALAESMLGLGLGAEAQTLLRVTMKDDPREAASPATVGLAAIGALLAGRPEEARDLADPRLTGTDEVALWRAIQTAMSDDASPAAAAVFATTAPLLFTYPTELRRRMLPLAMETMIRGGQAEAAAPLLAQREHDPGLAYARALLKQAQGDKDAALALFDTLANSRSALDHARAASRAVELRLAMGQLDAKAAADALETQLYAWRGDRRDLALRLRIAELRAQQGAWRTVFSLLRGAKAEFPGQAAEIDRRLKDAFAAVPRDLSLGKMEPTDLIAMLEENAELMAEGPDGEPMRELLAEKLMALDLPKRADPLLTKLMRAAPLGPARAGFGATLATLRLHEDDSDGAILALSESSSADMGDAVRARRALITARVEAKRGDAGGALETLSGDQTTDAAEARADILEQAHDWPAARDALAALEARVVPDSGVLDDAQLGVVLRLATAATHADDDATLTALRLKLRTRVGTGPQADMFRLLTAEPVRGTSDLGRSRTEIGLARAITADMAVKPTAARSP